MTIEVEENQVKVVSSEPKGEYISRREQIMMTRAAAGFRKPLKTHHWVGNVEVIGFDKDGFSGVAEI